MIRQPGISDHLATDIKGVDALRQKAREQSPEALKATAKQFEAMFLNMVMKSMREATPQESPFDSEQSRMFTSMLDQQFSQTMAERGVGLADVLIRQLSTLPGALPAAGGEKGAGIPEPLERALSISPASPPLNAPAASATPPQEYRSTARSAHVRDFENRLVAHAEEASRATGIPAKFMLGQAALESGWGKREIRAADGSASHNLFGIKAGRGWKGKVVEAVTTEYVNGVAQKRIEKFRAYDSYADAFKDYAGLMRRNPRYEQVLANAQDVRGFAQGLQRAGYATDPQYASKLMRIIQNSLSA